MVHRRDTNWVPSVFRVASFAFAIGTASTGCGQATSDPLGTSSLAITNGTPDDANGPTVLVVAKVGSQTGYCSGVVVSPHVVLTAAHCSTVDAAYSIFLGADYNDATAKADAANTIAVAEHHPHPKYDSAKNDNDVGVLITTSPIPRAPATMNHDPFVDADLNKPIRIVGYGETGGGSKAFGQRKEANTTLAGYDPTSFAMVGTPNICLYDSGGPTFMTRGGGEVVIGVHMLVDTTTCDHQGVDMRVDPYVDFIDDQVAAADSPADAGGPDDAAPGDPVSPAGTSASRTSTGCAVQGAGTPSSWCPSAALLLGIALFRRRFARARRKA